MMEKLVSGMFLALSIVYVFYARELSFGALTAPKAGFLPLVSGISAVALSFAVLLRQLFAPNKAPAEKTNWRKSILIMLGIFAYLIGIKIAGYGIATFAVMLYWFKVTDTPGWVGPCSIAGLVAVLGKLVFEQYLGIRLP